MVELIIMIPSITLFQHSCQCSFCNCSVVCIISSFYSIQMRIRSYLFFVASNDTESQKKGMVHVTWPEGDFSNTPMPLHNESRGLIKRAMAGMPIRIAVIHFCMPDTLYFWLLRSFVTTSMYFSQRSRIRFHVGTSPIARGISSRIRYHFLCVNLFWFLAAQSQLRE